MIEKDYDSVLDHMCLSSGELWSIPIILDINKKTKDKHNIEVNSRIALRDHEGFLVAILNITDIWEADKTKEAKLIYGTTDENHPGVHYLYHSIENYYIGGNLELSELPKHYDYQL